MATVAERIPTRQIRERARQVHLGRLVLTLLAVLLFGCGWLAARLVTAIVAAVLWSAAAIRLGWREARPRGSAG